MNQIAEVQAPTPAVIEQRSTAAVIATPMDMIAHAVANGAPIETMEKLLALQERWEANEARKAFVAARAAFAANPPTITKNKHVAFVTSRGDTEYDHATLDNVCGTLGPALARHGLSWTWKTEYLDNSQIQVTCVLTHVLGHSESTTLRGQPDNSGGKNTIQAVGSTVTYLQRYTLLAITGMATAEQDDDGAGPAPQTITMDQVAQLQDALAATGSDIAAFCQWMKVGSLAEIPAEGFKVAMDRINAKRRKGAAQ